MDAGWQVCTGVVAGLVMLVRVAVAAWQARIDGQIAAERARHDAAARRRRSEHRLR
jgi:hypothetical protein